MSLKNHKQPFWVGFIVFVIDQMTKVFAVQYLTVLKKIELTPFFNVTLVYNPGVSFGMFQSHLPWMRIILICLAFVLMGWLVYALAKSESFIEKICYSLILGGAFSNVIDRFTYGAVVDFLDFHLFQYHWPAFNIADSAIVVGVLCILGQQFMKQLKYKKG